MLLIALKNILNNKLKSMLICSGIIIGVVSVITVMSIGKSGADEINNKLSDLGLGGLIVTSENSSFLYTDSPFTKTDIDNINKYPFVESASPIIYKNASYGLNTFINGFIFGLSNNTNEIAGENLLYGSCFSVTDLITGGNVCLIDNKTALKIYGRENIVGKNIIVKIDGKSFDVTVKGIISSDSPIGSIIKTYASNVLFLPVSTICYMAGEDSYNCISLSVINGYEVNTAKNQVAAKLKEIKPDCNVIVSSMTSQQVQLENTVKLITGIITAVASVSMLVGGSGIMSVMLSSINERKKEIGIKLSVGATASAIKREIMLESILITNFSGIIGIIISYPIVIIACKYLNVSAQIHLQTIIFALLFCAFIGIIFSIYPASKAAKLNPIECLRNE